MPLALIAALAMLLLWSGPASADPLTDAVGDTVGQLTEELPQIPGEDETQPTADDTAQPGSSDTGQQDGTGSDPAAEQGTFTAADAPVVGCVGITEPAALLACLLPQAPEECQGAADLDELLACVDEITNGGELPTCDELADELGVEPNPCDSLPDCIDASAFPDEASPLLELLVELGVPVCATEEPVDEDPTTGGGVQGPYYANCDDARAQGAAPVLATDPGYRPALDSDNDGIGCEVDENTGTVVPVGNTVVTPPTVLTGTLAYTGFELTPMLAGGGALLALGGTVLLAARRRS